MPSETLDGRTSGETSALKESSISYSRLDREEAEQARGGSIHLKPNKAENMDLVNISAISHSKKEEGFISKSSIKNTGLDKLSSPSPEISHRNSPMHSPKQK